MTVIGRDGKPIQFAGGGNNVIIDRRVGERRAVDHITPERRVNDRRKAEPPKQSPAKRIAQTAVSGQARISSYISEQALNERLNKFLDDLLTAAEKQSQPVSDEEVVQVLTTSPSTKQFVISTPCWEEGAL